MIGHAAPLRACFVLTEPADPRYKYIANLRRRFGEFLRSASTSLRQQGEENTVDAVHILVRERIPAVYPYVSLNFELRSVLFELMP